MLKIGGIRYQVECVDNLEENGESVWGLAKYELATIAIRRNMTATKIDQTLIHESVHAMLHEAGLDEEAYDERLVTALGNQLYQFVIDNNELLQRFQDDQNEFDKQAEFNVGRVS